MKKRIPILMAATLCLVLAGCGNDQVAPPVSEDAVNTTEQEAALPPDLTGEWEQVDGNSEDSYQTATIQDGAMEIYWVTDGGETKALYWAGSYTAPTTADEPYSWESVNDTEKTDSALLASGDETKTFTYSDGQITYDVTAMGITETVKLEKQ